MIANTLLSSVAIAGLASQGLKILLFWLRKERVTWKDIFVTGSMPSSHSALVTSLTLTILFTEGLSPSFFVSFVLASIVIRDSLGVRRSVGEEGKKINEIIKKSKIRITQVHYSLGHKPKEVFAGIAIGVMSALLVLLL